MDSLAIRLRLARRHFDVELELEVAGTETVALIGRSGAGKTSALRAVAGLERHAEGGIALAGEVWLDSERRLSLPAERRRVGYLPQDYGLLPHLSVERNVAFGARRQRPDLLERLGVSHLAKARPAGLSGGESQRVALARALARDPQVLLLDEPFGALDAITRAEVRDELGEMLTRFELPALLVTHGFDDAAALATRIGVLDRGRLLQLGTPEQLMAQPADPTVARLLGMTILRGFAEVSGATRRVALDGGAVFGAQPGPVGPVEVAVAPWNLELGVEGIATTVTAVKPKGSAWLVRTDRLALEIPATDDPPPVGSLVHVAPRPGTSHVFPVSSPPA